MNAGPVIVLISAISFNGTFSYGCYMGNQTGFNKLAMLKLKLEETMPDTFDEDRERVTMGIKPGGISGR